jgi:predicted HTH transcriptional regulator
LICLLGSLDVEMIEIELSNITETDLQRLINDSASESNSIEYKDRLTLNTDPEKKEILKDLSAFANSSGGDILFGVKAEKGIPKQLVGIDIDNKDSMTLRIEDILRYGIQPRIPYVKIHFVPLQNNRSVLIIRVPKSWLSPHRVIFNKNNEFYLRLSAGSYPMDVDQLRTAFLASETLNKKIEVHLPIS